MIFFRHSLALGFIKRVLNDLRNLFKTGNAYILFGFKLHFSTIDNTSSIFLTHHRIKLQDVFLKAFIPGH